MAAAQVPENHGDEWLYLILTMRGRYINSNLNPLTKFITNRSSIEFKDILQWIIFQMIMKTFPVSTRIVISYAVKQGIQLWIWWKVYGNWDNNINTGKAIVEQILAREEKNKSKIAGLHVLRPWDVSRKVNHLSKVVWEKLKQSLPARCKKYNFILIFRLIHVFSIQCDILGEEFS